MKKAVVVILFVCAMTLDFAIAQHPTKPVCESSGNPIEKPQPQREPGSINPLMLKMKKDFIRDNFVIETAKKEAFWNAYNTYEHSIIEAHRAQREFRKNNNLPNRINADSVSNLSDDAILQYYENNFTTKNLISKAEEDFFKDLKTILTPQQIAQYYLLEKNFQASAVKMKHSQPMKMEMKPLDKNLQAVPMKKKMN